MSLYKSIPVLSQRLIDAWELDARWAKLVDLREGTLCRRCGCSWRSRQLAKTIVDVANERLCLSSKSLRELSKQPAFRVWRIAEINSAGGLHPFLFRLPHLHYSEYQSKHRSIRSEDLTALTYPDESLDLVITSETLEHVPDLNRALTEIYRVLKPGGYHLFTVPHVEGKPTRTRAKIEGGKLIHLHPPSYHGSVSVDATDMLVFHEPGDDFLDLCQSVGFEAALRADAGNPAVATFVTRRPTNS